MSALLTINVPLRDVMITVRFDGSIQRNGVDVIAEAAEQLACHFDVREVEPGELETIVISAIMKAVV